MRASGVRVVRGVVRVEAGRVRVVRGVVRAVRGAVRVVGGGVWASQILYKKGCRGRSGLSRSPASGWIGSHLQVEIPDSGTSLQFVRPAGYGFSSLADWT